jgi:TRAP-type C4-dicarboxylate transport system permease large subunit
MSQNGDVKILGRTPTEWFLTLPIFCLLVLTLVIGTGEMFHGKLLRIGEKAFGDPAAGIQYFMLRADPKSPQCNANPDIEAAVQAEMNKPATAGDSIDALFAEDVKDPEAVRASLMKAAELCQEQHVMYGKIQSHLTPGVKMYRAVETTFFGIFRFGMENRSLILLLMVFLASINTTLGEHHIALRTPKTRMDFRVYTVSMFAANALLTFSSWQYLLVQQNSGIVIDRPWLNWIWIVMFGVLSLISFVQMFRIPKHATAGGGFGLAALSVPLYANMSLIGGIYFLSHGHFSAQAIYLNQMVELSGIFLNLGLFVWAGMLLKQTQLVDRFLDILRPWKFSPEMLTYFILLGAAVPTAYTGASGIFIIAAGALIYNEVRLAGGTRQFSMAASAMSGSLGVVLMPCLLIVLIAALNKQVTTAQLYGWGFWVFLLTSTLFLIAAQLSRTAKVQIANPRDAVPAMLKAVIPVIPYIIVVAIIWAVYFYLLDTKLDEFTAPVIMPLMMVFILVYDRLRKNRKPDADENLTGHSAAVPGRGFDSIERAVRFATTETISHIGALILLMALSLSIGGMVERSGLMEAFPHQFANIWVAMALFVAILVFVGMVMDPFGAVILVSATIAPIAYSNGIDPVHFWMVVLVSFELGYLSPPVALNQLLLRQVIGDDETDKAAADVKGRSFYRRYERWILPVVVMGTGLALVAFVPLSDTAKDIYQMIVKLFA